MKKLIYKIIICQAMAVAGIVGGREDFCNSTSIDSLSSSDDYINTRSCFSGVIESTKKMFYRAMAVAGIVKKEAKKEEKFSDISAPSDESCTDNDFEIAEEGKIANTPFFISTPNLPKRSTKKEEVLIQNNANDTKMENQSDEKPFESGDIEDEDCNRCIRCVDCCLSCCCAPCKLLENVQINC